MPRTAALTLLWLALGCDRSASSDGQVRGAPATSNTAPIASAAVDVGARGWALGERYPYRLKLATSLAFGGELNAFDFDLTGSLVVAPTAVEGGEATLFAVLVGPRIESRVPDRNGEFVKIAQQLETFGCFFTFRRGLVASMHLAPGLAPLTVSIYRQLGATLQFARTQGNAARYEALEYDGTGQYSAEYQQEPSGSFSKRKLKYLHILSKQDAATEPALARIVPEVLASRSQIQLSPAGRPLIVRLQDELRVNGAQIPVHSKTSVSLDAEAAEHGGEVKDWRELAKKLERLAADEPYGAPATVEALDAARIKGLTFEDIVAKLRARPAAAPVSSSARPTNPADEAKQEAPDAESSSLFVALAAVFRHDPKAVQQAVRLAQTQGEIANTLVDALGSSGSPAAHKALAELLTRSGVPPKIRQRALSGLSATPRPSPEAIEALKGELARKPFSADAIYGLGSYSRYFHEQGDDAQAKALGDVLVDRLQHAEDIEYRLTVALGGITNAGYTAGFDAVAPHFADRRPAVRAAAVRALQLMQGEKVEALIAGTMASDSEYRVVLAAVEAARAHQSTDALVNALGRVVLGSTNPNVRYRAVQLLRDWSEHRPEIRSRLREVAEKDSEEQVRALARAPQ